MISRRSIWNGSLTTMAVRKRCPRIRSMADRMLCEEQFGHTTDILVRRAFGNVYEPLLHCKGAQVERWLAPTVRGEREGGSER